MHSNQTSSAGVAGGKQWLWFLGLAGIFLAIECLVPLGSAIKLGADEDYELSRTILFVKGFHFYTEVWMDPFKHRCGAARPAPWTEPDGRPAATADMMARPGRVGSTDRRAEFFYTKGLFISSVPALIPPEFIIAMDIQCQISSVMVAT